MPVRFEIEQMTPLTPVLPVEPEIDKLPVTARVAPAGTVKQPPRVLPTEPFRPTMLRLLIVVVPLDSVGWFPGTKFPITTLSPGWGTVLLQPVQLDAVVQLIDVPPAQVHVKAMPYGPTKGPPEPTGGAPAGSCESLDVSRIARARLRRPLPV